MSRCTALVTQFSRCGDRDVIRDFCTSLYPEGPAIRLCQRHTDQFHTTAILAMRDDPNGSVRFDEICDQWRWAPDCA